MKKAKEDFSNTISKDLHEMWVKARRESQARAVVHEHWIWGVLFSIIMWGFIYIGFKFLWKAFDWINYTRPM